MSNPNATIQDIDTIDLTQLEEFVFGISNGSSSSGTTLLSNAFLKIARQKSAFS